MSTKPVVAAVGHLLAGQISVITGASSGLGRATALAFMRQGAAVVCADRTPTSSKMQPTHELIKENGGKSIFAPTDVSNEQSVQRLIRTAVAEFGRVDM